MTEEEFNPSTCENGKERYTDIVNVVAIVCIVKVFEELLLK